jgi:uncharacterized protein YlxW (UPF0749 family)
MARSWLACDWQTAGVVFLLGVFAVGAACAQSASQGNAKTAARLQATQLQLAQHQAQVTALQQQVVKEEAATKLASDRLKEQDQAIGKMQQELQALRPTPASGHQ